MERSNKEKIETKIVLDFFKEVILERADSLTIYEDDVINYKQGMPSNRMGEFFTNKIKPELTFDQIRELLMFTRYFKGKNNGDRRISSALSDFEYTLFNDLLEDPYYNINKNNPAERDNAKEKFYTDIINQALLTEINAIHKKTKNNSEALDSSISECIECIIKSFSEEELEEHYKYLSKLHYESTLSTAAHGSDALKDIQRMGAAILCVNNYIANEMKKRKTNVGKITK